MQKIRYEDLKKECENIIKNAKEKKDVEIDGSYYGTIYILDNDAYINGQAYDVFAKRYEKTNMLFMLCSTSCN